MKTFVSSCWLFVLVLYGAVKSYGQAPLPRVDYVVQNPKHFPLSRGYFMVSNMADTTQQRIVNDSLKNWFYKPTEFYTHKKNRPVGFKNYKNRKGETLWQYHCQCSAPGQKDTSGGIVLKDSDSLQLLGPNGFNKGTGAHICTWSTVVYDTTLLVIAVEYDPQAEQDTIEDPIFMDLNTGRKVHPHAVIRFTPDRQDSLNTFVRNRIEKNFITQYSYKSAVVDPQIPDSIAMTRWDIMNYYFGGNIPVSIRFKLDGVTRDGKKIHLDQSFMLTLAELSWFTDESYKRDLDPDNLH